MDYNYNGFLFLPLGGVGGIGMNVTLYHFQGKWLMVDLGAGFADDYMPGIDMVVADISFIKERKEDLLGIILTHAHEDHFGAVQYLWNDLKCPVYTTKFTATFLKAKLAEFSLQDKIPVNEVDITKELCIGPFNIEFINLTHSIPEMNAVAIHTEDGSILHTGDWKFDDNPIIGSSSNIKKLKELGSKGVLAMICDSTNIFTEGRSGSESEVVDGLSNIVKDCKQAVAVSLFASNVARIQTIAHIATQFNRKVVLLGRSLWRVVIAAQESGYLEDVGEFFNAKQASRFPRNQLLFICTGCQGEVLAASAKLSRNSYPLAKLLAGDTIIFSARIIPGNEKRIYNVFNQFVDMGVKVITEKMKHIHVSGHPARDEICMMYSLVRPKLAIPVHGEYMHMYEHANLAKECGVEKSIIVHPGDVVNLNSGEKVHSVKVGYFGIDGKSLHHPEGDVMKMRRQMRDAGIVIVTLVINRKRQLMKDPKIFAPGVLDQFQDKGILKRISQQISNEIHVQKIKNVNKYVISVVHSLLRNYVAKKPFVEIQVEQL